MKKLMLLIAMLTMVVVLASVAGPAMAQDPKAGRKAARQAAKAERKAAKAALPSAKMKEMPKTGGVPFNTALLGLGASAMLVGGGLVVRRVTR
jgi:LPXTG-motif cell wall-anchored protein